MNISKKNLSENCINFSFYTLFAGFFFYQSSIGLNIFPSILGGGFGVISMLLFPFVFLSFFYLTGRKYSRYSAIDIIFFTIIVLSVLTSLSNFVLSKPSGFDVDIMIWSISGVLFNLICYMLAKSITLTSKTFIVLMAVTLLLMGAVVLLNIGKRGIFFLQLGANSDSVASYQSFGRSLFVVALYVIVLVKIKFLKVLLFAFSIPVLFLNGARTEFVIFIAVFSVLVLRRSEYSTYVGMLLLAVLAVIMLNIDNILTILPKSRMLHVFDIFSSASGVSRLQMQFYAWSTIQDNPLMGDYGSYVNFNGSGAGVGSYTHNLLSAWVNLGLIGFIMYISALMISIYHAARVFFLRQYRDEESDFLLVFVVAVLIALIFSKDYSYMLFGFMVGLTSRFIYRVKTMKNIKSTNLL